MSICWETCPSGWNQMEDADNRLITEPAPIGTDRLEGQRCKYAEKSYTYKYDLGTGFQSSCQYYIVKLGVQSVRETERERERGCCLHCVTAATCGEEEDKRLLPLCFRVIVFLSHIVYFTACGLSWFFPLCGFSTLHHVSSHCFCLLRVFRAYILYSVVAERTSGSESQQSGIRALVWRKKWMIR